MIISAIARVVYWIVLMPMAVCILLFGVLTTPASTIFRVVAQDRGVMFAASAAISLLTLCLVYLTILAEVVK